MVELTKERWHCFRFLVEIDLYVLREKATQPELPSTPCISLLAKIILQHIPLTHHHKVVCFPIDQMDFRARI